MDPALKTQLRRKVLDASDDFGLQKILSSSFVRQMTDSMQASASDMAYSISALLEYPHHINTLNDAEAEKNKKLLSRGQAKEGQNENVNTRNVQ